jgi:predicted aldo/keto reductase-like oxidoreductase
MKYIDFGKTGMKVSEIGFGGIPIIRLPKEEAVKVLRHSLDRGITFYDTANAYKDSEEKMGVAFRGIRDQVIIATKTLRRDAESATEQLENSLRMMKTDYIDLYQLHQVAREEEFQAITAPGGSLEAVLRAKEAGKVRHIGVTSHSLQMAIKLVKTGLFSSIQFPFNFIESDASKELFPLALEQDMGILVMKPFAGGVIDNADIAFKYLRQYPDAIPIPGYDSEEKVDQIVSIYERENQVNEQDLATFDDYRQKLGKAFCRRCEYCMPCPNGVRITMAMGYPIFVSRMGPKVATEFARIPMDSVVNCTECGECLPKCPYELPIPEVLKRNYALYKKDREENPE